MMYKSETCDFVIIEEELNELLRDEKIRKLRTALVEFVIERLRERMLVHLEDAGFNAEVELRFLAGETDVLYAGDSESREAGSGRRLAACDGYAVGGGNAAVSQGDWNCGESVAFLPESYSSSGRSNAGKNPRPSDADTGAAAGI